MQSACAVLYCHLWTAWLYHIFSHYRYKWRYLGLKLLNIKCAFLYLSTNSSEKYLILRRTVWEVINVGKPVCKLLSFSVWILIFSTDFREILRYQTSWKSFQQEPSCNTWTGRRTEGQTEIKKLISAFRKFEKAPRNQSVNSVQGEYRCLFPGSVQTT